jgi:hypothetical protein
MSQKYLKKIVNRYTQTYDTTNSPEIKKKCGCYVCKDKLLCVI